MCQGQCHLRTAVQGHHLQRQEHLPTYVRPHLEYAVVCWSLWTVGDKEVLERVQRRAVGMVTNWEGQNVRGPACRGGHDDLGGQKGQGGHDRHLQGLVWEGQGGAKLTLWAAGEWYWTADKAGGWGPPDQNPVGQA